jgi:formate dehydrogenase major subunit
MTNHWIDLRNSDCIMIIGSNAAENHPISFKWVTAAKERGAKLISVDPRFTRTSSKANIYARIRSGTDIAFIGGMICHVLEDMRKNPQNYNIDYVSQYTNAAYIISSGIGLPADNAGLFSGWDGTKYDKSTWQYAGGTDPTAEGKLLSEYWQDWINRSIPFPEVAWEELDDHCVLRLLYEHFKRYDKNTVSNITGVSEEKLEEVYAEFAKTGQKGKAGTIMYAMGTTQHTHGTQNIRAYAILQLLLANMGAAGGGINALRGTSNVQGSTDMCLLSHIVPGYLKVPTDADADTTYAGYLTRIAPENITPPDELEGNNPVNWWGKTPRYVASLLKAWWPNAGLGVSYDYLPKTKSGVNYTHIGMFEAMGKGDIEGLWVWGQNPAVGGPNSIGERAALANLKWMVVVDIWMNETAEFWKRPGVNPADIDTEVFALPAACSYEKHGSISNSGRWAQWRYKAVDPPGDEGVVKSDLEWMSRMMLKLKELYDADASAPARDAITELDWTYGEDPDPEEVAREINGYVLVDFTTGTRKYRAGELIDSFVDLQDDGTTACGNWLYCNQYNTWDETRDGNFMNAKVEYTKLGNSFTAINKLKKRGASDTGLEIGLYSDWTWCWPLNRRIIYNRASVDLDGNPWDSAHPVIRWDGTDWEGDVKDGGGGPVRGGGNLPFIMKPEGVAHLWGTGLKDGPIPEVYEPWESPITNLMSAQQYNPAAFIGELMNSHGTNDQYPYVGMTYRCTEHWQTGIMTRNLPWLNELMPEMYVELGEDLAWTLNIDTGDKVIVSSARGDVKAVAVVTQRFKVITVNDKPIHHVGVLNHWGYSGLSKGDSGNILTPHVGDANTTIPEYKTFLCNVRRA